MGIATACCVDGTGTHMHFLCVLAALTTIYLVIPSLQSITMEAINFMTTVHFNTLSMSNKATHDDVNTWSTIECTGLKLLRCNQLHKD